MDFFLGLLTSPWALLVLFGCTVIDGFFPPIPSETLVIALTATAMSQGSPNILLLAGVTWLAAVIGDNIAYLIGRKAGFQNWRMFSGRRSRLSMNAARRALDGRGVPTLFVARYIPVGRVLVNMTAGSLGYPRRKFVAITMASGALWTAQCLLFAAIGDAWFGDNPLFSAGAGIVAALIVGFGLDAVIRAVGRRRAARAARPAESEIRTRTVSESRGAREYARAPR